MQNTYFTDENVEKEKGIIGQEINMYEDYPEWQVYINAMKCLYKNNPISIDIAGSIESISKINKEVLYECYNTFYNPSNMVLVLCGDHEPEELLEEVKKRLVEKHKQGEIKRIYPKEEEKINQKKTVVEMEVSNPLFVIGFKDKIEEKEEMVKRHIAIQILLQMLLGKSSGLYQRLYEKGLLLSNPSLDYEFSKQYAHVLISGQSKNPEELLREICMEIKKQQENMIDEKYFNRIKKKIYGDYISEYNDVSDIARTFLSDYMKGINSFEYLENYSLVTTQYAYQILKQVFNEENMIISIVKGKD